MSKARIGISIVCIAVLLCLTLSSMAAERRILGQVVLVGEDLSVGGFPAAAGTTLFSGDVLKTGYSPVVLSLYDGRRITLSSKTEARLLRVGEQISVIPVSGTIFDSSKSNNWTTGLTTVQLSKTNNNRHRGKKASPKGPPFDPPGPPPNTPPHDPPGPPDDRYTPPGHDRNGIPPGHQPGTGPPGQNKP